MKRKAIRKVIVVMLAVVMVFGTTSIALAHSADYDYTLSNLAPNGGVLWSQVTSYHYASEQFGSIDPDNFTSGTHFTCRVYSYYDHTDAGKRMEYLNVYPSTTYNSALIYEDYRGTQWRSQMKFSNDETTKVVSAGGWDTH